MVRFVDENDFEKQGEMVFMRTFRKTDPLKSQSINNFCGIDISQSTPSVSLSVSLFSLEEI